MSKPQSTSSSGHVRGSKTLESTWKSAAKNGTPRRKTSDKRKSKRQSANQAWLICGPQSPPVTHKSNQTNGVNTMNERTIIYISGPISKGSWQGNYEQAEIAMRELIERGYSPINPMMTMKMDDAEDITHATWMAIDLPQVRVSAAVLRLPGESIGADTETSHASLYGIPVFFSIDELDQWEHCKLKLAE